MTTKTYGGVSYRATLCQILHLLIIKIIIIIILSGIGLSPSGSGYFTCIQSMKLITNKLKWGGLHQKHVLTTWNLLYAEKFSDSEVSRRGQLVRNVWFRQPSAVARTAVFFWQFNFIT